MKIYLMIPGYEAYSVTHDGIVRSIEREIVLSSFLLDGYRIVSTFRNSKTETLPVHRAVALAWVHNPDPEKKTIVNHIDGNKLNNHKDNLGWVTYSENNYHAVNNQLRIDNVPALLRDYETGEVKEFPSLAQLAVSIGMTRDTPIAMLRPKQFGKLVKGRYEVRLKDETTPWFYHDGKEKITPARYEITVHDKGNVEKIYSTRALRKRFRLYNTKRQDIPSLVELARKMNPELTIEVVDAYASGYIKPKRTVRRSLIKSVKARQGEQEFVFKSLSSAARYFGVDRSTITARISNGHDWNGWYFEEYGPHAE